MEKLNNLLERMASPFKTYANYLLRIGLGLSFFLHGYGKIPINEGFVGWLASQGVPSANAIAPALAWGEMLSGLGIIFGGNSVRFYEIRCILSASETPNK